MTSIQLDVDGVTYEDDVEPRLLLIHYLPDSLGRTGTPIGCDTSNCGACTVHLNDRAVKSCSVLAVQADGGEVVTSQGFGGPDGLHPSRRPSTSAMPFSVVTARRVWRRWISLAITRTPPMSRSARGLRATSVAVRVTRTS